MIIIVISAKTSDTSGIFYQIKIGVSAKKISSNRSLFLIMILLQKINILKLIKYTYI